MSDFAIEKIALEVRSNNPDLPRQWQSMNCSLSSAGITYDFLDIMDLFKNGKVALVVDLPSIETIDNYQSGKSDAKHAFQVKSKGFVILHNCPDQTVADSWVYKVMKAKMGPSSKSNYDSDSDPGSDGLSSSSEHSDGHVSPRTAEQERKEAKKRELARKAEENNLKKSKQKTGSSKKTSKSSGSQKDPEKTSSAKKDKKKSDSKKSTKANTDSAEDLKKSPKNDGTAEYESPFMAHYNELKQQERQKHFESLSTSELVKLVSGGLEKEVQEAKEKILEKWANAKKIKLAEIHQIELEELQKRQQREIDEIPKRLKELKSQAI